MHEYRSSQGRLAMYYYNLADSPLQEFRTDVPAVSAVAAADAAEQ